MKKMVVPTRDVISTVAADWARLQQQVKCVFRSAGRNPPHSFKYLTASVSV